MTRYSDNKNYKFSGHGRDRPPGRPGPRHGGRRILPRRRGRRPSTRDWGRKRVQLLNNGANATNGYPQRLIIGNVQQAGSYPGGLITSGPLKGTTFAGGHRPGPSPTAIRSSRTR